MSETKKFLVPISFILLVVVSGLSLYTWVHLHTFYTASILLIFVHLSVFFHVLNLRDPESGNRNDSKAHLIENQSGKIAYLILMISAGLILIISEGVNANNIENIPLLMVVGLALIIQPITEFFYARKYK
ncbi:hypothetical protein [Salipaludibacillus aurantiacus]|uniref:Uncharacterized protein n=1 Tax=Salipaludibacillus aurantiacus TaxID=1601833 RepID=A0A1H9S7R4_9BACI|nr:hypothetical protein [Salipaludibacillus aurantiacus]SER80219.1 hypothetical protein SAMN05518684_10436 [Salipaludibacillus aurantiacus]